MSRWRLEAWRRKGSLVVGVDRQQAVWLPAAADAPVACAHAQLGAALSALRPTHIDLVAAPDLAVHWMQHVPSALAHLTELQQVAQVRCAHLFGGQPPDWRITGDWRLDRSFPCAALPEATAQRIMQSLTAIGTQVRWHTTWSLLCAQAHSLFPGEGWSAVHTPRHLQLWQCRSGHVQQVETLPLSSQDDMNDAIARADAYLRLTNAAFDTAPAQDTAPRIRWLDLSGAALHPHDRIDPVPWPTRHTPTAPDEATVAWALARQLQERT